MKLYILVPLAIAGVVLVAGCGADTTTFSLNIVHKECKGRSTDLFAGADKAKIKITGEGIDAYEQEIKIPGTSDLPTIPFGKQRLVEVTISRGGRELGYGVSEPVDVTESASPEVTVIVYPYYDAVRAANSTNQCTEMITPRAGHSVALLQDGRVLIAGGYTTGGWQQPSGLLDSAELFIPRTGEVHAAAKMCPNGDSTKCSPRAFAPAVTLTDGRVLIAGGLTRGADQKPESSHALIYDPDKDSWTQVLMISARRWNSATMLEHSSNGKVIVIGGVADQAHGGNILDTIEIFDPKTNAFVLSSEHTEVPIARHGVGVFTSQKAIGIAGGITMDNGVPVVSRMLASFSGDTGKRIASKVQGLETGVVGAGVVGVGRQLLVYGGATAFLPESEGLLADGSYDQGSIASVVQQWSGSTVTPPIVVPTGLANPCTSRIDDNRSWIAGGLNISFSVFDDMFFAVDTGNKVAISSVQKPTVDTAQGLEDNRVDAGCIQLNEHQVLVTGGLGNTQGANKPLRTLEIFSVAKL